VSLDYRQFHEKGTPSPKTEAQSKGQWWLLEDVERARAVAATLEVLAKQQDLRLKQILISSRLYGNQTMMGPNGMSFSKLQVLHPSLRERISFNVVQSAIDTILSKTTKSKPKPLFLTSGGDYKQQRRAKKLNKFVEGLFFEQKSYVKGAEAMRDGCVWGTGAVHVFEKDGRVCHERTLTHELWVDELEGFYGNPRSMYHCRNVDRETLAAQFPDYRKEIMRAEQGSPDTTGYAQTTSDLVELREAWHLPSSEDSEDGVHCLSIDDCCLFSEPWTKDHFPFAFFHWERRLHGFWGQGLAEQIQGIQLEVNKLLNVIQRAHHLGGSFKVLIENGSKIVKEHLNNDVGAIIAYTGQKPEYVVPPLVPPEIYTHLKTLRDAAYEQAGISQLSASSRKPEGIESGKALRAFNDIESERFVTVGQAYEQFYLDLAKLSVECAQDIAKRHRGHYTVKVPGKLDVLELDWADIDLDRDAYVMQAFPISSLPSDPSGRWQTIQEYVAAGWITKRQGKRLMNFPDLEAVEGLENAAEDYLTMILDRIVDEGVATPPDPLDDLVLARSLALEYYQRGKTNGLEPERLELLRVFMQQIDDLQQAAQEAAMPPAPPMSPEVGGPPQAVPMGPPVSDLLPNVPQPPA